MPDSRLDIGSAAMDSVVAAHSRGDYAKALALLTPLAEAGDAEGQLWMGALHANAQGVPSDMQAAYRWCEKAATQGHPVAQANLGNMLMAGIGVPQDDAAAGHWLLRAAEQSEAKAQFDLASLYAKGRGMAEDHEAAAMWYERSASNGYYPAQARLGYLYANGIGVKKSRVQAFLWLSLAAQHGVGSALKALEEVGRQMSVEEKAQGGQLLDHWRRKLGRSGAMRLNPVLG